MLMVVDWDAYEPFLSLGLAIGAGLLIGLEREQSQDRDREHGPFIGGVRTFPLFALLGCLSMLLRPTAVSWLPLAAFCGVWSCSWPSLTPMTCGISATAV